MLRFVLLLLVGRVLAETPAEGERPPDGPGLSVNELLASNGFADLDALLRSRGIQPGAPGFRVISVSGRVTEPLAAAALAQQTAALRACWNAAATPTSGDITVTVAFKKRGPPSRVSVDADTARPATISPCIVKTAQSVDASASGTATFQIGLSARLPAEPTPPGVQYGSLDKSVIDMVIKRRMKELRYCYQRILREFPTLAGKITVKFIIAPDGTVAAAATKSTTMNNPQVEDCINGRFREMVFPEPRGGGIVVVSYPFIFSPG